MRDPVEGRIIQDMYCGMTTVQEFHWDSLTCVSLWSLVTAEDVKYIRKLITSPRYAGNPRLKYNKLDEFMKKKGFSKFAGGTNRSVYTHPDAPQAVFKVALDSVGLSDNPAEYANQFKIKPYCCKVFECSPCGTIASFEKVERIISIKQFYSISDEYFRTLVKKILGRYVMEDIGIKYFMNVGIRPGFGAVVLDFPYLFELDGSKLRCQNTDESGTVCGGEVDYDSGFNKLVCGKCGHEYKAKDLEKSNNSSSKSKVICDKECNPMVFELYGEDGKAIETIYTDTERTFVVSKPYQDPNSSRPKKKKEKPFKVIVETEEVEVEVPDIIVEIPEQIKPDKSIEIVEAPPQAEVKTEPDLPQIEEETDLDEEESWSEMASGQLSDLLNSLTRKNKNNR